MSARGNRSYFRGKIGIDRLAESFGGSWREHMSGEPIQAFPLQWPPGWPRTESWRRRRAKFLNAKRELSVMDGIQRVLEQLAFFKVKRDDLVISTNIPVRLDGLPRSDRTASDPGVAVYWRKAKETRCMAID